MRSKRTTLRHLPGLYVGAALLAFSSAGWAMVPYSQDFEFLNSEDGTVLGNDGWLTYGNVFDSGGGFKFGYGSFPAPNGGSAFSGIVGGMGGAAQGNQQLSIYSDYNCCDLAPPPEDDQGHGNGTDLVESNVFQEQTISVGDVDATWTFTFDVKAGDIGGATTAVASIKTLDPDNGYALTNFISSDTTSVVAWETRSLSITIDSGLVGQILQFGFTSTSSNFETSGVLYDNISFTSGDAALLSGYSQDFDGLNLADGGTIGDGWLAFGSVFDSGGGFKFGYGPFPAPNGGESFSSIVDGQGGAAQGTQQLSVYNDYACCGAGTTNEGHFGTDLVESNVFQERSIGLGDVGTAWEFQFDGKAGNIGGSTTAVAFIKTIDPSAGFSQTNFLTVDTTALGGTWSTNSISISIIPELAGQLLQFGFASTASNFGDSGVFYDNVSFSQLVSDTDGDGVTDDVDNCTLVANPGQEDTNGDLIGNKCDADLTNGCSVSFGDLSVFKSAFPPNPYNPDADFDSSGSVNFGDLAFLKSTFFNGANPGPGPGAPGNGCE